MRAITGSVPHITSRDGAAAPVTGRQPFEWPSGGFALSIHIYEDLPAPLLREVRVMRVAGRTQPHPHDDAPDTAAAFERLAGLPEDRSARRCGTI